MLVFYRALKVPPLVTHKTGSKSEHLCVHSCATINKDTLPLCEYLERETFHEDVYK